MIRKMIKSDINNLIELEMSTFNHSLGYEFFIKALDNSFSYFYVYEDNNNILGYISSIFDGDIIEILNFCVNKDYRRLGIASKLLNHLLQTLYKLNAKSAILEVRESNIPAINLYNSFGFKYINTRKNYYSDLENAKVLQKLFTSVLDIKYSYYDLIANEKNKDYILIDNKYVIKNDNSKLINKIKKNDNYLIESNNELIGFNKDINYNIFYSNLKGIKFDIKYNDINVNKDNNLIEFNILNIGYIKAFIFYDNLYVYDILINIDYRNKLYFKSLFMYMINYVTKLNIFNIYVNSNDNLLNDILKKWGLNVINSYHVYSD